MAFTPNYLSQRDPRWKDETLGFDSTITIGTDGCALTCLAMLVNGYGFSETPSTLNQKLKAMGAGSGFIGGLVIWGSLTRSFPKITYQNILQWNSPPADLTSIDASLDAGQPVVVEIDRSPSPGVQNHWVVVYDKQGDDYLILDPWSYPADSAPVTLGGRYGSGRNLEDFILAGVWYLAQGSSAPSAPPTGPGFYVQVNLDLVTGLNLRSGPATRANLITREPAGSWLKSLEPEDAAHAKVGVQDQWLNIQDPQGRNGYVAAWYVHTQDQPNPTPPPPAPPPSPAGLTVLVASQVTAGLNLRDQPNTNGQVLANEPPGTALTALEAAASAQAKLGQQNQWLYVRDATGKSGYVAAWLVVLKSDSAPAQPTPPPAGDDSGSPTGLTVQVASLATAGLRLRDQPNMNGAPITVEPVGASLEVIEPAGPARAKVGVQDQWLNVRDGNGNTGYVAAWLVELGKDSGTPTPPSPPPAAFNVVVSSQASAGLRLRSQPNTDGSILKVLMPGTLLTVVESASGARAKIGVSGQWLNVREPGGQVGFVAANYVIV